MRKVIMLNRVSIDGFFAGPNGEIEWFVHDAEVDKAAHEMADADTVLFGRKTYQMFEGYWPKVAGDPNAPPEARVIANELNEMTKVVFSKTLKAATWENSKLATSNLAEEVKRLKQGSGADMLIFGSGTIVQQLTAGGFIDEYLFIVTPVVLGAGKSLFKGVQKLNLGHVEARHFNSGNVLLHYKTTSS